jgi:hypothetical protein
MTLKRWGPIFMILSLVAAVAVPAMADYLGPNRTVTTYVWKRLHCRYQAIYDPPGAGWYGCYLHLYQTPDSTCPSTDSVVTFFNPKDCSWPSDFCQDPGCSITLSSSKEDCSEGQTGCRATETTVTHPPATVSGSLTCAVPGDNGWCRGGGQLGLSGTEPLSGYSILALEGTRNGETFACTGASCSVPLVEGTNDFTFWALSSWGDSSLKGTASGKLDSSPPVISGELTGTAGESGWYVSEVTVAASASDAVSGVATFEMALDGGGWAAYNGPVALTDGDHVVDLRAMDSAGNVSTQSQAVRVDTQPPSLTLDADSSFCPGCGETLGIGIGIQDLGSGVMEWTLSVDGTAIKSGSGLSSETLNWNGSGLAAGAHTLLLQARDVAGNSSEASQGVTLVAPTQPPPPPPTTVPSRPREDAPVATATPTATSTSTPSVVNEASPTPTHTADYEPTRTPSTFIFGGPPAAPPDELPGEGLTRPDSAPGESLTGSGSAPGESLTAPEPAVEGDSSNVLWGAGAAALIAAATAVALEATRRRKEAEALEREEMARRNAQAEAREEAERQRLAALAAARQEAELRMEELADRQDAEQIRQEAMAARHEAWQQHHADVLEAARLEAERQRQAALAAAAAAAAASRMVANREKESRAERLRRTVERREDTDRGSAEPVLMPVPSFWSSPLDWVQASLINAGRKNKTVSDALVTSAEAWDRYVKPAVDSSANFLAGIGYQWLKSNVDILGKISEIINPDRRMHESFEQALRHFERKAPDSTSFRIGRIVGGVLTIPQAIVEGISGAGISGVGVAACGTGILCFEGAPALGVGLVIIAHGVAVAVNGVYEAGEQVVSLVSDSSSIGGKSDAFQEAKSGGKHSGTYENYKDRPIQELERALDSYEKQVITHKDKILNPENYISGWEKLTLQVREGLLRKWQSDLDRNQELADVIRGILQERGP